LNAVAFTTGRDIFFDSGEYRPETQAGSRILAHELAHVVQQAQGVVPSLAAAGTAGDRFEQEAERAAGVVTGQSSGRADGAVAAAVGDRAPRVQRLVRRSLVNCPAGQNPFSADRRAAELLDNAITRIDAAQAARPADPANADVVAVGNAMRTAFRLNPANADNWTLGAPRFGLPLIRRRLEAARDYINSVVFTFNCCTVGGPCPMTCGTCGAGEEAFVCAGEASIIALCPLFWTRNQNQRGRTLAHEVLHINFGFIEDWAQPDRANAHCYAQFTALLNGFNSPVGFRCH
jgi:hypothetical protein